MSKTYEALKRAEATREQAKGADEVHLPEDGHATLLGSADDYFEVRRSLRSIHVGTDLKTILVVSALHGEGASTVACQFARAVADGGRSRVLLADLNLRTPSLRRLTRAKEQTGFINVVVEGRPAAEMVQPTDTPGVSILAAGTGRASAIDVLDTDRAVELIGGLSELADVVFADAPPVTLYPDARALAPRFDGIILVVEADATPVSVAARATQILRDAGSNLVGTVLNKRRDYIPEVVSRLVG